MLAVGACFAFWAIFLRELSTPRAPRGQRPDRVEFFDEPARQRTRAKAAPEPYCEEAPSESTSSVRGELIVPAACGAIRMTIRVDGHAIWGNCVLPGRFRCEYAGFAPTGTTVTWSAAGTTSVETALETAHADVGTVTLGSALTAGVEIVSRDGAPVRDALVRFLGPTGGSIGSGRTDAEGLCDIPLQPVFRPKADRPVGAVAGVKIRVSARGHADALADAASEGSSRPQRVVLDPSAGPRVVIRRGSAAVQGARVEIAQAGLWQFVPGPQHLDQGTTGPDGSLVVCWPADVPTAVVSVQPPEGHAVVGIASHSEANTAEGAQLDLDRAIPVRAQFLRAKAPLRGAGVTLATRWDAKAATHLRATTDDVGLAEWYVVPRGGGLDLVVWQVTSVDGAGRPLFVHGTLEPAARATGSETLVVDADASLTPSWWATVRGADASRVEDVRFLAPTGQGTRVGILVDEIDSKLVLRDAEGRRLWRMTLDPPPHPEDEPVPSGASCTALVWLRGRGCVVGEVSLQQLLASKDGPPVQIDLDRCVPPHPLTLRLEAGIATPATPVLIHWSLGTRSGRKWIGSGTLLGTSDEESIPVPCATGELQVGAVRLADGAAGAANVAWGGDVPDALVLRLGLPRDFECRIALPQDVAAEEVNASLKPVSQLLASVPCQFDGTVVRGRRAPLHGYQLHVRAQRTSDGTEFVLLLPAEEANGGEYSLAEFEVR